MTTMEDIKAKIHDLNELWKSAPEELRSAAPDILRNTTDIIATACLYFEQLESLQRIADCLLIGVHVSPETADTLLNKCRDNSFVTKNREALFETMISIETCDNGLLQGMQDMFGAAVNRIMIVGLVSGGVCAAIEGYNAYKLWQLMKDAKNLVERSGGQRERITGELSDIKPLVRSLDKAFADLRRSDLSKYDSECAKAAAEYFINELRIKVGEFLIEINDLHFVVNGMKEKLRLNKNSAITGSVYGGSAISNAFILSGFANPILAGITAGIGVLHGLHAFTSVVQHKITSEQLKRLRKQVEAIEELRNYGLRIQNDDNRIMREIMALTLGRNRKIDFNKYN